MLTPLDIESKQFSKSAVGGYNAAEVRKFMREILNGYEKLYRENIEMKDKIALLNDGIGYYKTLEETLQNTLILAEKMAEDTRNSARKKAETIEKEAELKAESILRDARNQNHDLVNKRDELLKNYETTKIQIKQFLRTQLEIVERNDFDINSLTNQESTT